MKSISNLRLGALVVLLVKAAPLAILAPALAFAGCAADGAPDDAGEVDPEHVDEVGVTFDEFKKTVYQEPESGVFIVHGDTPIDNERELELFYEEHVREGALIVHQKTGGGDAKWDDTQKKNLTYCVSTTFGSNYGAVVSAMSAAAAAWEAAANGTVHFIHLSSQDSECTSGNLNVVFDVRPVSGAPYYMRAFFPDSPRVNRNVLIDSSSFGSIAPWTVTGILQHELGHSLGFRHEHIRPESAATASYCIESQDYRALTPYDAASVMHYPSCNGTQTGDLVITQKDKDGVNLLYNTGCDHSVCLSGPALNASACGATVASVCAADSYCCTTWWDSACVAEVYSVANNLSCNTGSCAHPLCEAGAALTSGCDPNGHVAAICAADPYCCSTAWDSLCVAEVASVTGKACDSVCAHDKCQTGGPLNAASCGPAVASVCDVDPYCCSTSWDGTCVAEVYSIAGSVACSTGSCAHPLCQSGGALASGCDPNGAVAAVCGADPYCCSTGWDGLCISEITSVAGKSCH